MGKILLIVGSIIFIYGIITLFIGYTEDKTYVGVGFVSILIGFAIAYWNWLVIRRRKNMPNPNHIDILKERLAKGEITKEEFDDLKNKLGS